MRKTVISVALVALVAAVPGSALAGKKTIHKSFSAGPHAPIPVLSDADPNGCRNGEEGVHKTTVPFKTPGKGLLKVGLEAFEGDWDLYVTTKTGTVIAASDASQLQGSPQEENITVPLGAKKSVNIVACNWAGGPTAEGHYTYKYKK
jgi:hypothetical protein